MTQHAISLETAVAITGRSRRTWWRRLAAGEARRVGNDARGRTMLAWNDVLPWVLTAIDADDLQMVLRADAGDADAQNDIGQLLAIADEHEAAHYWLNQAARQHHADAMQWLARSTLAGQGTRADENIALMWLAKSAAHGSTIAQAQMRALRRGWLAPHG